MKLNVVVSVTILKDKKILMVQEGKKHCFRQWNLPAGHLEYGENLLNSAIREVHEETGYKVKIKHLSGVYNYVNPLTKVHCVRFDFLADLVGGKPKVDNKEILALKWFSLDEIKQMKDSEIRSARIVRRIIRDVASKKRYPLKIISDLL